jgi:phosphonopyruvate decarboxylase
MIHTPDFYEYLLKKKLDTFYGVPDSLLKNLCAYITSKTRPKNHIITANEGNAIALAAGKYLATGSPAVVYLQNSGLGNTVNPLLSLADEDVYKIPMLLIIGWRGEPGKKDEPQHIKQGKTTISMLNLMNIDHCILSDNFKEDLDRACEHMRTNLKSFALVVRKNTFSDFVFNEDINHFSLKREEALKTIIDSINKEDIIVSTTGKTSREIFELREKKLDEHDKDFLTVGSMGHASSIALGLSLNSNKKVYCIDGDGSLLMHLGGLGVAAINSKKNFKYIVINNGSHESVGGQPTIGFLIDLQKIFIGLGFKKVFEVSSTEEIRNIFDKFSLMEKSVLVINVGQGSRINLGRPSISPQENKKLLMNFLRTKDK